MTYVYESERHVLNIIKKALSQKGLEVNHWQEDTIEIFIDETWDMQDDEWKAGVMKRYNTHLPLNSLTWWAYEGDYPTTESYIEFIDGFISQFRAFFRAVMEEALTKDTPNLDLVFKGKWFDVGNFIDTEFKGRAAESFRKEMPTLQGKTGVYFLFDRNKELIYVGKSINLGERMVSSISERGARFYEYALTETASDVSVYEAYYISLLKPKLNVEGKHQDPLTIKLDCIRNNKVKPIYERAIADGNI